MKACEFLIEYNQANLISLFDQKFKNQVKNDPSADFESLVEFLHSIEQPLREQNKFQFIDPYMKWIAQRYVTGKLNRFEDVMSKVIPYLLKYDALKRKNKLKPEHRDINQVKDINQLMDWVDEYQEVETASQSEQQKAIEQKFYNSGEAELIYNDSEIKVVVPKTKRASCYFGTNTRWCNAATSGKNYFQQYNKQGPLYIVLIKPKNQRYQFHFQTRSFMNERDEPINPNELADQYPKLWDIFTPIAEKNKSIYLNKNPSEELQLAAVKKEPIDIKYIKNPSEAVQLAAVKKEPIDIEYIKNPSEAVQLAAVKQYSRAIKYIKNPSEAVQLAAVKQYGRAIEFIKNPSEAVQLAAVKRDSWAIQFIKNPSEAVQLESVKQNKKVIQYIKNPTPKVLAYVKKMNNK